MKQAQETAAEAIAQRRAGLRLIVQAGVVHAQFFQRVRQGAVVVAVRRVDAAVHHGRHGLVAGQRGLGRAGGIGDGVAHAGVAHLLDGGRHIAHLACHQGVPGNVARAADAHLHHVKLGARLHHAHAHAGLQHAVDDAHKADGAAVVVIHRIKHQGLQRRMLVSLRRRHVLHDDLQHLVDARAQLGRYPGGMGCVQPDHFLHLAAGLVRVRAGEVNLVDDGDGLQVVLQRQVHVGQRLRLHALGGIYHQQRALAGGQRAADLVGEVHMAGGVDEVEGVFLPILGGIAHGNGLGFDGDAALALQLHGVHDLVHHLPLLVDAGLLQDAVGQGGLAVVDVRDDAEVADFL